MPSDSFRFGLFFLARKQLSALRVGLPWLVAYFQGAVRASVRARPWWVNQSASKLHGLSIHQSVSQSLRPCVRALRNELNKSALAEVAATAAAPSC